MSKKNKNNSCSIEGCLSKTDVKLRKNYKDYLCNRHYRQHLKGIPFGIYTYAKYPQIEIKEDHAIINTVSGHKFIIDIEFVEKAKQKIWSHIDDGRGHIYCSSRGTLLHRLILDCPDHLVVDHINGNTLDNRINNIRIVTPTINNFNRTVENNRLGVEYIHGREKPYRGRITIDGKIKYLGSFKTLEEARETYQKAAKHEIERLINNLELSKPLNKTK